VKTVTVRQLATALEVSERTIRWHCSEPGGLLYGKATRTETPRGDIWSIPEDAALYFATHWEPHITKRGPRT
jgi:hypothetical protein